MTMNDEEEKYEEHVKKGWSFAKKTAETLTDDEHLRSELAVKIFDKLVSPLHYFLQGNRSGEPSIQPPTERQIEFARNLEIKNPEKFSREELSKKIDEALKLKKKEEAV
jgi:hypothetical protein